MPGLAGALAPVLGVALDLDDGVGDFLEAVYADAHDADALLDALATFLPPSTLLPAVTAELKDKIALALSAPARDVVVRVAVAPTAEKPSTKSVSTDASTEAASSDGEGDAPPAEGTLSAELVGALAILKGLQPALSDDVVIYVLVNVCRGNMDEAAERLLEDPEAAEAMFANRQSALKQQADAERKARQRVVARFDLRPDGAAQASSRKHEDKQSGVRYLDGKVVATKGERFIVQDTRPEWDGGSRGRVKTKGKRGPGFVSG